MHNLAKTLLWYALGLIRNALDPFVRFKEVSILCYHSISDSLHETAVTPEMLESHVMLLRNRGYVFVSLADIVAWAAGERALPRKAVALTFDDGYADFKSRALPAIGKFGAPATVFVVGSDHAAQQHLDAVPLLTEVELDALRANPSIEVGYHSKTHPNFTKLTGEELVREVEPPFPSRYFAYPGGNHSKEAVQALKVAGYTAAFTIRPTLVHRGTNPYLLPRSVVLKSMTPGDVVLRASKAADWYFTLARFFV